MRFNWSLQTRFLLATSVLTVVLCTIFAFAVYEFIELLEDELLNRTLVREMQEFKTQVAANPHARPPSATGLVGFIVRTPQEAADLPQELQSLGIGRLEDFSFRGGTYFVAVDTVGSTRLYLLLDTVRVDNIEGNIVSIAALVGLLAIGIAATIGVALSRAVMRPVTALANEVASLDPSKRNKRLTHESSDRAASDDRAASEGISSGERIPSGSRLRSRFANREVGVIATAFDDYMDRLEKVLEREHAFTEDASHELRTPLSIISSAAEILLEEPQLSGAGRERLLRIRRAVTQMQSLIEALLFLARDEPGGPPQLCSLDQIARESVDLVAASAAAKSLTLEVHIEPTPASGAPIMMACVINNLLLNAVNFTQQGSISVQLSPRELVVKDTGIGIPPEDLSRIFERRYRGAHSRGLGLGLYLVNRICQRLSWKIEALSAPGLGTTFRIELPVVAVAPTATVGVA